MGRSIGWCAAWVALGCGPTEPAGDPVDGPRPDPSVEVASAEPASAEVAPPAAATWTALRSLQAGFYSYGVALRRVACAGTRPGCAERIVVVNGHDQVPQLALQLGLLRSGEVQSQPTRVGRRAWHHTDALSIELDGPLGSSFDADEELLLSSLASETSEVAGGGLWLVRGEDLGVEPAPVLVGVAASAVAALPRVGAARPDLVVASYVGPAPEVPVVRCAPLGQAPAADDSPVRASALSGMQVQSLDAAAELVGGVWWLRPMPDGSDPGDGWAPVAYVDLPGTHRLLPADVDGDGVLDVVAAGRAIALLRTGEDGLPTCATLPWEAPGAPEGEGFALDLDVVRLAPDALEVVVARGCFSSRECGAALGTGLGVLGHTVRDGAVAASWFRALPGMPSAVHVDDLDDDGAPDLLVGRMAEGLADEDACALQPPERLCGSGMCLGAPLLWVDGLAADARAEAIALAVGEDPTPQTPLLSAIEPYAALDAAACGPATPHEVPAGGVISAVGPDPVLGVGSVSGPGGPRAFHHVRGERHLVLAEATAGEIVEIAWCKPPSPGYLLPSASPLGAPVDFLLSIPAGRAAAPGTAP